MQIRVQGELSSFSRPPSGHWYFTLKDDKAQVRCAMFRNRNQHVRFNPKEGDQVVLTAKVSLYEGRGDFQLIGELMAPDGEGQLLQAFEQLKARLQHAGLFAPEHKKAIPLPPKHLGVITSATGAAVHDILAVLKRRFPSLPVTIYPAQVQGNTAAKELISALNLAQAHGVADLLIIGRGGGSLEDLWCFNDEALARAIFACDIPIISAVGHEVDFTIADWVADVRAPTPSAAAELISPDQDALRMQLDQHHQRIVRLMNQQLMQRRVTLRNLAQRLRHPGERIRTQRLQITQAQQRLNRALQGQIKQQRQRLTLAKQRLQAQSPLRRLQQQRQQLMQLEQQLIQRYKRLHEQRMHALRLQVTRLNAVNPLTVLERGYAIVQTEQGEVVTHSAQLKTGQHLTTQLAHGRVTSKVIATQPE